MIEARSPYGNTPGEVRAFFERCQEARWPGDPLPAATVDWLTARESARVAWLELARTIQHAANAIGIGRTSALPTTAEVTALTVAAHRAADIARDAQVAYRRAEDTRP